MLTFGLFVFVMGCNVHLHPYKDYLNQSVGHANMTPSPRRWARRITLLAWIRAAPYGHMNTAQSEAASRQQRGQFHNRLIVKTLSWSLINLASLFDGMTSISPLAHRVFFHGG
jgi:hypothetical protein